MGIDGVIFSPKGADPISLENARLYQQMQQALEDALLNQISIVQTTVSVWWIEPDGRIFYVNDAGCKGLGCRRKTWWPT